MPKKKSLNTEIDQIFSDMPASEQASLERPEKPVVWRRVVVIVILLSALALGAWYYVGPGASLADHLPADAEFYVALELPVADTWYERFKFWQNAPRVGTGAARLYQKLGFNEQLLPLLVGQIELARPSGGGVVFRARLADKAGWLKLVGVEQTLTMAPASWWTTLAVPDSKIYWLTDGADLYLADRADVLAWIKNKPAEPLARQLGNSLIKRDLLTIYVSNLAFLNNLAPAYAAPLQAFLSGPLIIKARLDGQKLVWSTPGAEINYSAESDGQSNYDLAISARDFSQVYSGWKNVLSGNILPANIAQLEQIAKEFYQLDIEFLASKLGTRDNIFYLSGADWLFLAKGGQEPAGEEISQALKGLASSLFAITHPQAVERTLSDGSIMTELRAETDGLEWRPYTWTAGGREYGLDYLQGQGEPRGFYTGFVPELGYVLTNQAEWLQSLPTLPASADLAVTLSPRLLTNDSFILDIIKRLGIDATVAGELSGYLEFWH